jgi:hypothetical protein
VVTSTAYGDQLPAASCIVTQDLPLLWASLVAFREAIPPEETRVRAQIDRLITALEHEQARRHEPGRQAAEIIRPGEACLVWIEPPGGRLHAM